jgi:hypothetical protein
VVERVADAGLRGEMNDAVGPLLGEGRLDDSPVSEIALDEGKPLLLRQPLEPGLFQRHVVIGAEIVEADDRVAALQEPRRRVVANEAGGAGDQNSHRDAFLSLARPLSLEPREQKPPCGPAVNRLRRGAEAVSRPRLTLPEALVIEHPNQPNL